MDKTRVARRLAVGQGAFFIVTGLWPIVHLRSFEAVTGPKLEGWLVKTVGALIAVAGLALSVAGRRPQPGLETAVLGAGTAVALGAIDVWYAGRRRIHPIYLADAAVELGLASAWAATVASLRPAPDPDASRAAVG